MAGFENGDEIKVAEAGVNDASSALHSDAYGHPENTNINRNSATANASNENHIKSTFTSVSAPSFAGGECSEAVSGGVGYMGIGASLGASSLNEKCEERKNFKAVCGDANDKTELALKALALSAQLPDTRIESHQAKGIANEQANLAMDANANCFDRMGIQHQPQAHIVEQAPPPADYATKQDVDEAEQRAKKYAGEVGDQVFKHSMKK